MIEFSKNRHTTVKIYEHKVSSHHDVIVEYDVESHLL